MLMSKNETGNQRTLWQRFKKFFYFLVILVLLCLAALVFNGWAMSGGNAGKLVSGFQTFKNISLVFQGVILLLIWLFWDSFIMNKIPESKSRQRDQIARNKNPTCIAAAIILFLVWLT